MNEEGIELVNSLKDDVIKAASHAKEKNMSQGIINGLETALQGMEELKPLIQKKVHVKRIRADLRDLVEDLLESSEKGYENTTMGNMRTLRDRVNVLKALFSRTEN